MSKKLGVAIVHELCPICTKEMDSSLVMNTKLTEKAAAAVEAMYETNKWSSEICPECKTMKEQGFILIGAVEAKTTDVTNPYRNGLLWCVKQEVAIELFKPYPPPASGVSFIDINVARQMNLPNTQED